MILATLTRVASTGSSGSACSDDQQAQAQDEQDELDMLAVDAPTQQDHIGHMAFHEILLLLKLLNPNLFNYFHKKRSQKCLKTAPLD